MLRCSLLLALASAVVGVAVPGRGAAEPTPVEQRFTASDARQLAVSRQLSQRGAVFYGAWWCPACTAQKSLFGREAAALLPYVECDRGDEGRERCQAADLRVYPTWDLDGRRLEGVRSVEELREWSGIAAESVN
ncbi:MAG: hypothetical protein VKK98_02665 [Cyanobacteriota bacterium]|nr:hypothetical protein [Cyanobacteriota bacterium]